MNMIEYMYIHIFTHKLFFMEQTLPNILCSAASGRTYGGIQGERGWTLWTGMDAMDATQVENLIRPGEFTMRWFEQP